MAGTVVRTSAVRLARPAAAMRRTAVMKLLYSIKRGGRDWASGESAHSVCADGRSCNPRNKKAPALRSRGLRTTRLAVSASRPGLFRGPLTDLDPFCAAARRTGLGLAAHPGLAAESTERWDARWLSRPGHRTSTAGEGARRFGGRRGRRGRGAGRRPGGGFRGRSLRGCALALGRSASLRRGALGGRLLGTGALRGALLCRAALRGRLLLSRGLLLRWHFSSLGCVTQSSRLVHADEDPLLLPAIYSIGSPQRQAFPHVPHQ